VFKRVKIAAPILVLCLGHYTASLVPPAEEAWSSQPRCHTSNHLRLVLALPRTTSMSLLLMSRADSLRTKDPRESINDKNSDEVPDGRAQHGVKMVEAVTLAWTKKTLATAYIL
jgi:hypothetical protein